MEEIPIAGYHKKEIKKGVYGQFSKIKEEFDELEDANNQWDKILIMCELSDLVGAIEAFAKEKFNLTLVDIKKFSDKTKQAFTDGKRK